MLQRTALDTNPGINGLLGFTFINTNDRRNIMGTWAIIGWITLGIAIGGLIGFFVTKKLFEKQIKDNPPITESMIRAMYNQMGRKPSEAQVRQIMRSMGQK